MPSVGVVIITHNAVGHLPYCLPPLLESPSKPRVLVVNSSSEDGTALLAKEMGTETLIVPRNTFNHGSTREKARKFLSTDIVVMLTPDAYLTDTTTIETLIAPIAAKEASVAYARQLPHKGASFLEALYREYNYPREGHIRTIKDLGHYGAYTFFCSNSCAAWSNSALDAIGGFENLLLGEDTLATAKLLRSGHSIAYVADATVYHSHSYSLKQEFQRAFDTGLARRQYRHLLAAAKNDSSRGYDYVKMMCRKVAKEKPYLLPYALIQVTAKFLGYTIGTASTKAPLWLKKFFSSQDFYWK